MSLNELSRFEYLFAMSLPPTSHNNSNSTGHGSLRNFARGIQPTGTAKENREAVKMAIRESNENGAV